MSEIFGLLIFYGWMHGKNMMSWERESQNEGEIQRGSGKDIFRCLLQTWIKVAGLTWSSEEILA